MSLTTTDFNSLDSLKAALKMGIKEEQLYRYVDETFSIDKKGEYHQLIQTAAQQIKTSFISILDFKWEKYANSPTANGELTVPDDLKTMENIVCFLQRDPIALPTLEDIVKSGFTLERNLTRMLHTVRFAHQIYLQRKKALGLHPYRILLFPEDSVSFIERYPYVIKKITLKFENWMNSQ